MTSIKDKENTRIIIVDFNKEQKNVSYYYSCLTQKEILKSKSFVFDYDRCAYIISHGVLNIILGNILQIPPMKLTYTEGEFGKPYLCMSINPNGFFFNLSHTKETAVITWGNSEIGIDIEEENLSLFDISSIAKTICSNTEFEIYQNLNPEDKNSFLYRLWVIKEAVLKASGYGLRIPMKRLNVLSKSKNDFSVSLEDNTKEANINYYYIKKKHIAAASFTHRLNFSNPKEWTLL